MSWAKQHDRCVWCGTTESPHGGRGLCKNCYSQARHNGLLQERVTKRTLMRQLDDETEYRCTRCERWSGVKGFYISTNRLKSGGVFVEMPCRACKDEYRRAYYAANKDTKIKARVRRHTERDRRGKMMDDIDRKKRNDPLAHWSRSGTGLVPAALLVPMIATIALDTGVDENEALAATIGCSDKMVRHVKRAQGTVSFDTAERIAIRANAIPTLMQYVGEPGVEGWAKNGVRFCQRCGSSRRRHWARGYCTRCYGAVLRFERLGRPVLPIPEERWSLTWQSCRACGTVTRPHVRRGLCQKCINRAYKAARVEGITVTQWMEREGFHTHDGPKSRQADPARARENKKGMPPIATEAVTSRRAGSNGVRENGGGEEIGRRPPSISERRDLWRQPELQQR